MKGWSCSLNEILCQTSTRMTSLEGVPPRPVVGADLHAGVPGGSGGLPLFTLANGTLMARRL